MVTLLPVSNEEEIYEYDEKDDQQQPLVEIDQNAAKSETVKNGWSDDERQPEAEIRATQCGWNISDDEQKNGRRVYAKKSTIKVGVAKFQEIGHFDSKNQTSDRYDKSSWRYSRAQG